MSKRVYLIQYGLLLLGVCYRGQLHFTHFLHLLVHVDLLLQLFDLCFEQLDRVLLVVLPRHRGGTGRVDRRDPVLQLRLAAGLHRGKRGRRTQDPL